MYSNDFLYFLEHQILVWCTNNSRHVSFCSALEAKTFKTIDGNVSLTDQQLREHCKEIHDNILGIVN